MSNFGTCEELNVCENIGDHLIGNVYIKFSDEDDCAKALQAVNGRFYAGNFFSFRSAQDGHLNTLFRRRAAPLG